MEKCRLCLNHETKLLSLFSINARCYADMAMAISNIKIHKDEKIVNKLCLTCCDKLTEAYNFKMLIERSDSVIRGLNNSKRILFNDINEVNLKIGISKLNREKNVDHFYINWDYENESFTYKNIVINRIIKPSKPKRTQRSLQSLPNELNLETEDDYESDRDYESNEEYKPVRVNLNMKTISGKKCKKAKKLGEKSLTEPVKPIYLEDIRVMRSKIIEVKAKKKYNYKRRLDVCPYCGKMFKSIKNHLLTHIGEKKYQCEICSKAFVSINKLNNHKKWHTKPRDLKCDKCIATFHRMESLKIHTRIHTGEKKYACEICKKSFRMSGHLKRHIALVHNIASKQYNCEQCNKVCKSPYALKHHMRVHTGERPYKCEICSQPYSYKHDFNRHCLKKHGVSFKRRSVYVMNEDILIKERALVRDLMLRVHGIVKDDRPLNPFEGPQSSYAFETTMKAIEAKQIPLDF